jgi:lipopolysaccharide transport system ATP-binding protein
MTSSSIQLQNVSLRFEGKCESTMGLRSWINVAFGNRTHASPSEYKVDALRNISLTIQEGEKVGLIGLNGAGKSTLLKVMAGIYPPTEGAAETRGHVCPMFEFATGFEMDQTGWDNIRIRGLLLGMSPREIEARLPEIGSFSELGEFLDYPVRTYSSGMFVRLAFAVSTSLNPEVLLIDEVMGAGDLNFAAKAKHRMQEFMKQGKILVFSSHSMDLLRAYCDRTIWLQKGSIVADDDTDSVLKRYASQGSLQ